MLTLTHALLRYKGKTYRSTLRIVRLAEQIPAFCRTVCLKLQCCPNLFGPALVEDKCPETCWLQTKTKYSESDVLAVAVATRTRCKSVRCCRPGSLLLREEEEVAEAGGGRRGGGGGRGQAGTPQEEEEEHLRAEETALGSGGLHPRRLPAGATAGSPPPSIP